MFVISCTGQYSDNKETYRTYVAEKQPSSGSWDSGWTSELGVAKRFANITDLLAWVRTGYFMGEFVPVPSGGAHYEIVEVEELPVTFRHVRVIV